MKKTDKDYGSSRQFFGNFKYGIFGVKQSAVRYLYRHEMFVYAGQAKGGSKDCKKNLAPSPCPNLLQLNTKRKNISV
jgi:hypothetical protein